MIIYLCKLFRVNEPFLMRFKDLVVSIDDLRNNFIKGSIYKNRPAQTCYHHAREKDILSRLEEYLAKHQLTSDTTDFYGARHVAGDLLEFIYSLSRNVTSRLLPGCGKVKDWVKFAEITPFKFFTDYFGEIDQNGDGKLQFSEIEEVYRTVLQA